MKTNISVLMNLISEYEKQLQEVSYVIRNHIYNTTVEELDGKVFVIEDNKEDFNDNLDLIEELIGKISKLKTLLYEKNSTFTLSDGRSIQAAIADNNNLRKLKGLYESFLMNRSSKKRVSEVNYPYFESREVNFDVKEIKSKIREIDSKLRETDFEISKLNSIEFEFDL